MLATWKKIIKWSSVDLPFSADYQQLKVLS